MSNFNALNLNPTLVKALEKMNFTKMSDVQSTAIPALLKGESLVIKAPTGSGKTLAYLVPILNDIKPVMKVQALIVLPTKVLVNQVLQTLKRFNELGYAFKAVAIVDGSTAKTRIKADIVITTPVLARTLDASADLSILKRTILDEGDMLIFGGFYREIEELLSKGYPGSLTIFTASIDEHLDTLVRKYIKASRVIDVTENTITAKNVTHNFINIRNLSKREALSIFLAKVKPYKTMVFASNKKDLAPLKEMLVTEGYSFSFIHGDLEKREQKKAYNAFNSDETVLLLASDIASRGVDIENVTDVISVDLPKDLVYYFHRAGRCGRFDRLGNSYIFYSPDDLSQVKDLLKKGCKPQYFTLREDGLRADRDLSTIKAVKKVNTVLEAEIRKSVHKVRTQKIKPNYKKKIKVAAERAKERHKRKIIRTNIAKKNQVK